MIRFAVYATLAGAIVAFVAWFNTDPHSNDTATPQHPKHKPSTPINPRVVNDALRLEAEQAIAGSHASAGQLEALGSRIFESGHWGLAEQFYRKAIETNPNASSTRLALGKLLYYSGRVHEARRTWTELLRTGGIDLLALPLLGNPQLTSPLYTESMKRGLKNDPDIVTQLANVHRYLREKKLRDAEKQLKSLTKDASDSDEFRILRLHYLSLSGKHEQLRTHVSTPELQPQTTTPDYLSLLGQFYRQNGDLASAFDAFRKAFELAPDHLQSNTQLAELLHIAGRHSVAERFQQRAHRLSHYRDLCRRIHNARALPARSVFINVIEVCKSLKLFRDANAWNQIGLAIHRNDEKLLSFERDLPPLIAPSDGRYSRKDDFNDWFPGTESLFAEQAPEADFNASELSTNASRVHFIDEAISGGIDFRYDNGRRDEIPTRFFEFIGGGVGVLDIDCDSYPDVIFTQGGSSPRLGRSVTANGSETAEPTDKLFQNRLGREFKETTLLAGISDTGYSHGCSSGDSNLDGFPDLYIANAGANCLWRNNGDGTFSTQEIAGDRRWTTSCVIADITGDSIPDLYDVNHIVAEGIHEKMCTSGTSTYPCDISKMKAEQDCLLEADGAGNFRNTTDDRGFTESDGIGLGIAVADFDNSRKLSVFVANDARPNFFFVRSEESGRFRNEATMRGIARSGEGSNQACMGVAVGDADSNGRLDLFVTNFYADYNTLYSQGTPGFFSDATAFSGLLTPSYTLLGFGTQFADLDLDGDLDIMLTNGDIEDLSATDSNRPWKQRSQLFINDSGRFSEMFGDSAGDYFSRPVLGRGLATLDWNIDGHPDFVVSHMQSPAALITNRTRPFRQHLKIQLVGVSTARTPIGASVTATLGNREIYRQLTAGCGFQAQNENCIHIGVDTASKIDQLVVEWPSGLTETFHDVATGRRVTIVESNGAFECPQ